MFCPKRAQSKNLSRSHLVFPKGFIKQESPSLQLLANVILCFRKLPLPQGSKPLPSLFGILVAVNTSSLESCSGEPPFSIGYSNLSFQKQKLNNHICNLVKEAPSNSTLQVHTFLKDQGMHSGYNTLSL